MAARPGVVGGADFVELTRATKAACSSAEGESPPPAPPRCSPLDP